MQKIRMQSNVAVVARAIDAGDRIPSRRRRFAVAAQIALAAAFDHGVAHIDAHGLRASGPHPPDLRGCETSRGDADLRRRGDAEGRGQLRLRAGQGDALKGVGRTTGLGPQIGKDVARRRHE